MVVKLPDVFMMLYDIPSQGDFVRQGVSCQPWCLCQQCEEWLGRLSLSLTSGSNNTRKVQELSELVASGWCYVSCVKELLFEFLLSRELDCQLCVMSSSDQIPEVFDPQI